jgi:hypothetical protein
MDESKASWKEETPRKIDGEGSETLIKNPNSPTSTLSLFSSVEESFPKVADSPESECVSFSSTEFSSIRQDVDKEDSRNLDDSGNLDDLGNLDNSASSPPNDERLEKNLPLESNERGCLQKQSASKQLCLPEFLKQPPPNDELGENLLLESDEEIGCLQKQSASMQLCPPQLLKQTPFRNEVKISKMMKGVSSLSLSDFHKYDTVEVEDPIASPSRKVAKANITNDAVIQGDGDVWVEKIFYTVKTKTPVSCFISKKTGERVRDEPPTGATRVIYLKT